MNRLCHRLHNFKHIRLMMCSHCPTPTQTAIQNGFNYNMQDCSHWLTPTPTPTQMQMGCKPILSVSVSVSVLASVNTPLAYVITKHSLAQMMLFKSPGAAGTTLGWHQVSTGVTSYHQTNVALVNKLRLPCAPLHGF